MEENFIQLKKQLEELTDRVTEIEKFLAEATKDMEDEESAEQYAQESTEGTYARQNSEVDHIPAVDYVGKEASVDEIEFVGTPREKLQWVRDDYTPFEQGMWETYDQWSIMTDNKTVSFNQWLKRKFPQHQSPGYMRACQLMAEANDNWAKAPKAGS